MANPPKKLTDKQMAKICDNLSGCAAVIRGLDLDNFILRIKSDPILRKDIQLIRWVKLAEITRKYQYDLERLAAQNKEKKDGNSGESNSTKGGKGNIG